MPAFHNCSTNDRVGIGLDRIKHVARKTVQKLLGRRGDFLRAHQINRLARLQASIAFSMVAKRGSVSKRKGAFIAGHPERLGSASLSQAGKSGQGKSGGGEFAGPFVYVSVTLMRRRRRAIAHIPSVRRTHHASVHHAAQPSCRPSRRKRPRAVPVSARHKARRARDARLPDRRCVSSAVFLAGHAFDWVGAWRLRSRTCRSVLAAIGAAAFGDIELDAFSSARTAAAADWVRLRRASR